MQLRNKVAVIYGAGGAVGAAVARAFAREGARLFLSDRSVEPLAIVAKDIVAAGGVAETSIVDTLDEGAVDRHLGRVVEKAGGLDISFNAIGIPNTDLQGTPLVELSLASYIHPIETYAKAHFVTARLGARRMLAKKSGTILTITAQPARRGTPLVGGMAAAWGAIEAYSVTQALRPALAVKRIALLAALPGPIDTDMVRDFPLPKASAADVAQRILAGIRRGDEEIFPDPMSQQLGAVWTKSPKDLERAFASAGREEAP
jgi:NAD(P)-dependent dehydrogenase (short-subunit alcohol dehydrogenase family)